MNFPVFHTWRRHQHREVGLSARAWESAADVVNLPVRIFDPDNQHMLCQPTLFLAQLASDPKRQAFFRQQRVPTIARTDAPDRIVLRIVTDKSLLYVEIGFRMQATGE